jgi:type II secretory pathway predicted ATPase ExeA/pSer/pThr/pTyr-binding forkhead associated (FHA) protein
MELGAAGLQEQPFRTHGRPLVFVAYAGQEAAFEYLERIYDHRLGLGLIQGPPLSGKSTLLRQFAECKTSDVAVAVVNGSGLNADGLLQAALSQFGYELESSSVNELLNMLKVFLQQQTASGQPPLLIIENTLEMNPSALRVLCELSGLRVRQHFALRLVLASDQSMSSMMDAPAMHGIAKRLGDIFKLRPLTQDETTDYLYAKLRAGGCFDPENVLPNDVCDELHDASGGWPGIIDRLAILALAKAEYCPIRPEQIERPVLPRFTEVDDADSSPDGDAEKIGAPQIILTLNGEILREMTMDRRRLLIGRSEHNDLCIKSSYISRHHAMFVKFGVATLLMDLNSRNGTFVNSRRVSNQVMIHDDIINIGNHRIKFVDPNAKERSVLEGASYADTVIMKDLSDVRKLLARGGTEALPIPPDLTAGDSDQ